MIKSNELRIGNYVLDSRGIESKIIGLFGEPSEEVWVGNEEIEGRDNIHSIKPIPLTEEWLIKFGFELDKEDDEYYRYPIKINDMDYLVGQIETKFFQIGHKIYWSYPFKVEYVHDLQNLYFALTGEELTIK